jgi:hypothetical protein
VFGNRRHDRRVPGRANEEIRQLFDTIKHEAPLYVPDRLALDGPLSPVATAPSGSIRAAASASKRQRGCV